MDDTISMRELIALAKELAESLKDCRGYGFEEEVRTAKIILKELRRLRYGAEIAPKSLMEWLTK
jgi:hypothetical protein